jgi:glucose/mannose-6-phosphate isomerase
MNLDDLPHLHAVDKSDMLGHIAAFPDQLQNAWALAQTFPLPESHRSPRQIVLCGMGGSAIGGDLMAALVAKTAPVPFIALRGYDLPAYVSGPDTLVIASSHSGNTEETLSSADQALGRGVRLLAITTGGALADHAQTNGYPLWLFNYKSQPRAALGWSFGLLLGLAHRLNLVAGLEANLKAAITLLRESAALYAADVPAATNPAKRQAGQLMGRIPVIYGSGLFEPVARRWKAQLNENTKMWAQHESMPEANHNVVTGIVFPAELMKVMLAMFISSPEYDHPRVLLRYQLTTRLYLEYGIGTDQFHPRGDSPLGQMLSAIQYGDYISLYAAVAHDTDPTEIAPIVQLKEQLALSDKS